jgi:hypothetical protein
MFLEPNDKLIVKCQVAKFLKIPFIKVKEQKIPQCDMDMDSIIPLCHIKRSKHQTFFYTQNNVIYFHESPLNQNEKIFTFYDYKKERYYWLKLDYKNTGPIYSIIKHFRASNGDTYFIYLSQQVEEDYRGRKISRRQTVIYNYTKNKIIYRDITKPLDEYTLKIPLANSLLVSLSPEGNYIWIRIIDITEGKESEDGNIRLLMTTLYDYFSRMIYFLGDRLSTTDFRRLNKMLSGIYYINHKNVEYDWSVKISITASTHNSDTVFYKGFNITFKKISLKSLRTVINNVFSLSFMLEDDKIVIRESTGKGGYIKIRGNTINIPSHEYLVTKKYPVRNKYDLSKSQLYSVVKASEEYIIMMDGSIFHFSPQTSKTYKEYKLDSRMNYALSHKIKYIFEDDNMSIIRIRSSSDPPLIILGLSSSKLSYKAAMHVTFKTHENVYMIDIHQLRDNVKHIQRKQNEKLLKIIEMPEEREKVVKIKEKLSETLSHMYGTKYADESYKYWHHVDEGEGHMYCLAIYKTISEDRNVILLKYNLKNDSMPPAIMGYVEIKSDDLQKNPKILDVQTQNLMTRQNVNPLQISRLLELYRYNLIHNYMNEIVVEVKYPLFKCSDLKYNRNKVFKYYDTKFNKVDYTATDRRHNIVIWYISLQVGEKHKTFYVPFVFSDLSINKKMPRAIIV